MFEPEFAAARMADYERMAKDWHLIGSALKADPDVEEKLGFTQRLSLGWFTGRLAQSRPEYEPSR